MESGIYLKFIEYCDGLAGNITAMAIEAESRSTDKKQRPCYRLRINSMHDQNVHFSTLVHELAHLYLGHLGSDAYLNIPDRSLLEHRERELEAESLAYVVCRRAGVQCDPESYLANYIRVGNPCDGIDIYSVMRTAGALEGLLGTRFASQLLLSTAISNM